MSPASASRAIEGAIATAWGATTTIAWPNVAFTPPTTGSWLKVDFLWGNGQVLTKDGRASIVGIVQFGLFGPKDLGDGALDGLAETARAIFNQRRLASPNLDIMFGSVSGPVRLFEESWRQLVVSAPFRIEEVI
jgi:uncharacterized protein DUF4128